jgi:hypothetical protein
LEEGLSQVGESGRAVSQEADSSDLGRLLRLGGRPRDGETTCEGVNECSPVHH